MSQAAEWVYEEIFWLPFGWRVIRVKKKFPLAIREQYNSPLLYRKKKIGVGRYGEQYWPKNPSEGK